MPHSNRTTMNGDNVTVQNDCEYEMPPGVYAMIDEVAEKAATQLAEGILDILKKIYDHNKQAGAPNNKTGA